MTNKAARQGFFSATWVAKRRPDLDQHNLQQVTAMLDWFHLHLAEPERFSHSTCKNRGGGFTKGLSWFWPDADLMVAKSRDLPQT